jgi:hypothetical protein
MKLTNWIKSYLKPEAMQFKELSLDDIMGALNDPWIRKYWINSMIEKVQVANMELDNLLTKEDRSRVWEAIAIERRTILRALTMILDARDILESEREAQESQNRTFEQYQGAAAPLDNRANNRATD